MKLFLSAMILTFSSFSMAEFEGTFLNKEAIPATINDVEIYLYDMAKTEKGCKAKQCFRIDVLLNGTQVATWAASPGKPTNDSDFPGVNTPAWDGRSLDESRVMGANYVSHRGDAMPYAAFILGSQGQATGFALHAGHVTGKKESHGCVRLELANAKTLNSWVRSAFKNKGSARIWSQNTKD